MATTKTKSKPEKQNYPISKEICRWKWGNNPTNDEYEGQRIAIRASRHYVKNFAWAEKLAKIAMKDFPKLRKEDIEIVIYGGDTIKGFMGIEFDPGNWEVPSSYEKVTRQHKTLH